MVEFGQHLCTMFAFKNIGCSDLRQTSLSRDRTPRGVVAHW